MSINFSTLKNLTIPEGNVKQIKDASGRVLWSAMKPVTITIDGPGSTYAYVEIDGVQYNGAATVEVPVGAVIHCVTGNAANANNERNAIRVNYQTAAYAVQATYDYTVISDATITLYEVLAYIGATPAANYLRGHIEIVDENAPNAALVNITAGGVASAPGTGQVTIDEVNYRIPINIGVPLGAVIVCAASWNSHSMYGSYGGQIKLNGTLVADRVSGVNPTTYEYTVNKDVQIDLVGVGSPTGVVTNINITEL